jgi:hypothetical protein
LSVPAPAPPSLSVDSFFFFFFSDNEPANTGTCSTVHCNMKSVNLPLLNHFCSKN